MDSSDQHTKPPPPGTQSNIAAPPSHSATNWQGPYDALTGLAGSTLFIHRLHQSMRLAEGEGHRIAVLCIGITPPGTHDEGGADQQLLAAAQRLLPWMGSYDTLGRLGGHEFMATLMISPPNADITTRCQQLTDALVRHAHQISSHIGVALFPHDGVTSKTLLHNASQACAYAVAHALPCHFCSGEAQRAAHEDSNIAAALPHAIANGQLQLLYQPLADLRSGAVAGLEALVRWLHPQRGLLSASEFVPAAEVAGLAAPLANWVLLRACRDLCAWRDSGQPGLRVTMNMSGAQFCDPAFPAHVLGALERHGLPPEMLALEIAETALTRAGVDCDATLAAFQRHGLGLILDDFGTGNSSLANLKRFPFDALKIDLAFVRDVCSNASDAAVCQTIIAMAHHLGMRAVAEGVETESQCDFLRRNMCDQIQGYFFSEPLPSEGVTQLLREQRRLPAHLLHSQQRQRRLLLVDDEPNIIASLKRLLRGEQYHIYTASNGQQGLDLLAQHAIDVIVSDQRMPGMLGVDFLRQAKQLYPDTIRIMLSSYTELQSVTDAVNEGAIYKFLTKPWKDDLLRNQIAEAFQVKEIADDNARLYQEVQAANRELAAANRRMEHLLRQKQHQTCRDEVSLGSTREVLRQLPLPIIGVNDAGIIAFANCSAESLFSQDGILLGGVTSKALPKLFNPGTGATDTVPQLRAMVNIGRWRYTTLTYPMGGRSAAQGTLIALVRAEDAP